MVQQSPTTLGKEHEPTRGTPRYRVLVVDDTPANLDVLSGILKDEYRVSVATSGEKALRSASGDLPPDIILLDVMMPGMDGYEVCRQLQAQPSTSGIPVIFVTAKSEEEDEARGFDLGAVDYIAKPVQPRVVLARVRTHLALREARRHIEEVSQKLARYLSPQLYRSIFEGSRDAEIGSMRKRLTVFMSDIVGFTTQTENMEAEDLTFLLNGYLNRMAEIVTKHGGTLDKYIGDAILAFFGDPDSKGVSEDAAACIRMALEMRTAVEELRAQWLKAGICSEFDVRMGITTGYCTVGNFGSLTRMDYTIIGSQVNLANRLQSSAQPGEILVGPETHGVTVEHFEFVEKEPLAVKGFEKPVRAFQVVGPLEGTVEKTRTEKSGPGFSIFLDPGSMDVADRKAALEALRAAISRIV